MCFQQVRTVAAVRRSGRDSTLRADYGVGRVDGMKTLAKSDFETLIDGLIDDDPRPVVSPQWHSGQFDDFDAACDLDFEHDPTIREQRRETRLVQHHRGMGQ